MLFKHKSDVGKTLYRSKPLLLTAQQGYIRPSQGKAWWMTTTTIWPVDELIRRSVRDWRRLTEETGHTGQRTGTMRKDHDSVYTGTHSVFPAPLMEWIVLRYGGPQGGTILDAFAGGPPRGVVAAIMGHKYHGVEIRQEQINENISVIKRIGLNGVVYHHSDGRYLNGVDISGGYDAAITCPPYWNLEVYSDQSNDLSAMPTYGQFNFGMWMCAHAHRRVMKPKAFVCIVIGNFRDKKTGELIDLRAHTVDNFREVGFYFHQEIILSKNFASAAKRSTMAWRGLKLVPRHEFLLVFRTP